MIRVVHWIYVIHVILVINMVQDIHVIHVILVIHMVRDIHVILVMRRTMHGNLFYLIIHPPTLFVLICQKQLLIIISHVTIVPLLLPRLHPHCNTS